MLIVQFEDFFHPDAGYGVNLLSKYFVKFGHQVVIITSEIEKSPVQLKSFFDCNQILEKDNQFTLSTGIKIHRVKTHFFFSGRAIVSLNVLKILSNYSPDIIYINGNDTFVGIIVSLCLRKFCVPIIFGSSMVEMASKNPLNWLFRNVYKHSIATILMKNDIKIIRKQDDDYVERHLGISLNQSPFISHGVDTDLFTPLDSKQTLRKKMGIPTDSFVMIYAGKVDISKGILNLMKSFDLIKAYNKNMFLLIVGNVNPEISIEFDNFLRNYQTMIAHFPTQKYSDLAKFYQISDLAIFPRQISLSFFNAQACGLPVLAESNNINDERLSHGNGIVFEYDSPRDFSLKIQQIVDLSDSDYLIMSNNALKYIRSGYDLNYLARSYLKIFGEEIDRFKFQS
jgi:glycosyltransferase involved in cell wall biosynthesis